MKLGRISCERLLIRGKPSCGVKAAINGGDGGAAGGSGSGRSSCGGGGGGGGGEGESSTCAGGHDCTVPVEGRLVRPEIGRREMGQRKGGCCCGDIMVRTATDAGNPDGRKGIDAAGAVCVVSPMSAASFAP
jgi:hypothetical protein